MTEQEIDILSEIAQLRYETAAVELDFKTPRMLGEQTRELQRQTMAEVVKTLVDSLSPAHSFIASDGRMALHVGVSLNSELRKKHGIPIPDLTEPDYKDW